MGLWMVFRRRWRMMLWIAFFVVILLNTLVFIDVSISKLARSKLYDKVDRDVSHFQVSFLVVRISLYIFIYKSVITHSISVYVNLFCLDTIVIEISIFSFNIIMQLLCNNV